MKELEEQIAVEAANEAKHLQEMKDLKVKIEAAPVKIIVKVAADGHVLGTVTTKHIAEAVEKQIGSKIDKRKITFTALVTALGDYTAKVQLNKEVIATISIIIALK
jgi:large subunit ribosomal protein L9